jgi:hypothetical protein
MVAARVIANADYEDLLAKGCSPQHFFKCSACEVIYRLFSKGDSALIKEALKNASFETGVEHSHPVHPDRFWVVQ